MLYFLLTLIKNHIHLKDEYIQKWEDTSKDVIGTFLRMFGQREWNFEDFGTIAEGALPRH